MSVQHTQSDRRAEHFECRFEEPVFLKGSSERTPTWTYERDGTGRPPFRN
ncbi:MAG: hypothetical protein H6737_24085 [Alphaproteobacteria bacterium]|nr:hypothetical protein [Alphaproteobacteria bacterium]